MKHLRLAMFVFSVLAVSSAVKAEEEYFRCSGGKGDNYITVLGAIENATNNIRIGAGTSQSTLTGYYKSVLVTGKAEMNQGVLKFSGSGGGSYASGYIVMGGNQPVSKFYSNEFEPLPLICSTAVKPDQHRVCSGRWYSCQNLLNEHGCCYESPH